MPVPFPSAYDVNLNPPDFEESQLNAAGILSATRPASGNSEFQLLLMEATFDAMTGHNITCAELGFVGAAENAANLANRSEGFRMRMVHMMVLSALVL